MADSAVQQMGDAGVAFGTLVSKVGEAVGETMLELCQSGAATASKLATTQVDVIAIERKLYNDDGTYQDVDSVTTRLPLINFVDPVFYEWTNVRLQGYFAVNQFQSSFSSDTFSHVSESGYGQAGLLLILGGGYNEDKFAGKTTQTSGTYTTESALGSMRMNALLTPKTDIGVPKPRMLIQGPQIAVLEGTITDVMDSSTPPKMTARTMDIILKYTKQDGSPIGNKTLSVETQGMGWKYKNPGATTTSVASGEVAIQLQRDFIGDTPDITPKDFVLTARIGLVSTSATIRF